MRADLQQQHRKAFLGYNNHRANALVNVLIDENRPDEAFKWYYLATTFDLANYTHLINTKVKDSEAQKLIDQWQENYQRLQFIYAKIDESSTLLYPQLNKLQLKNNQLAADVTKKYPEVAELFETTPEDIEKLKANIAPGTVVIQPALLNGIKSNSIAIFVITRDQPTIVKQVPIDGKEFDRLLTEYRAQLENPQC